MEHKIQSTDEVERNLLCDEFLCSAFRHGADDEHQRPLGGVKAPIMFAKINITVMDRIKLYHKIQNDRLGTGLMIPKAFPAGL